MQDKDKNKENKWYQDLAEIQKYVYVEYSNHYGETVDFKTVKKIVYITFKTLFKIIEKKDTFIPFIGKVYLFKGTPHTMPKLKEKYGDRPRVSLKINFSRLLKEAVYDSNRAEDLRRPSEGTD